MAELSKIEAELRRVGRVYVEGQGANRDELEPLVQEAIIAGMPADAVAHAAGVPVDDVQEMVDLPT
jgi:hypothetical protein